MRMQLLPLVVAIIAGVLIDLYIFRRLQQKGKRAAAVTIAGASLIALIAIIATAVMSARTTLSTPLWLVRAQQWALYIYFMIYVPRYLWMMIHSLSRLRAVRAKRFVNGCANAAAVLSFVIMLWGAVITPRQIEVREVTLTFDDLPAGFDGYRVALFSDAHLGTYGDDTTFTARFVEQINALNPDIVMFAGDLVSRVSTEADPHLGALSRLHAPDGVFSVLGNHDYDDYVCTINEQEKKADCERLRAIHQQIGWTLLCNQHTWLTHNGDSIALIGTENRGDDNRTNYDDLALAYPDLNDNHFKILLQHNPEAWQQEVTDSTNIRLTLAGHTHAFQMMVNLFGCRLSPAAMRFAQWGGLYEQNRQALYVNIGMGMVGPPCRIGATPEITLLTLRSR